MQTGGKFKIFFLECLNIETYGFDLNKILPDLLKLRMKVEKPDIHFSQHKYGQYALD